MEQITEYLQNLLASNQFFQGGIVLAAISWAFYQLKALPVFLLQKFRYFATYQIYFDQSNEFYDTFSNWFNDKYPQKFRNVEMRLWYDSGDDTHTSNSPRIAGSNNSEKRRKWTLKKLQYSDSNIIFYKNRILWINKSRRELDAARDATQMFHNSYSISGFFARNAIDALCTEILERKESESEQTALRVGFNSEGGYFDWQNVAIVKTLDHIFFEDKERLLADLEEFLTKKEFYRSKGINYKRSYMFYGPGGTGKTSLGIAIAKHLDYDLAIINLASIKDDITLQKLGTYIGKNTVVMLEDIDCILSDRNVNHDNLNFSTVLNFLDGLYAPSDCIFVMTTNRPEVLDTALTRKGRVDLSLLIDYPNKKQIEEFMSDFYECEINLPIGFSCNKPMSEIQDICLRNKTGVSALNEFLGLKTQAASNKN